MASRLNQPAHDTIPCPPPAPVTSVHVLVIEDPCDECELYVFASYAKALEKAGAWIVENLDILDDEDLVREALDLNVEDAIKTWNDEAYAPRIHIENQPILDMEGP